MKKLFYLKNQNIPISLKQLFSPSRDILIIGLVALFLRVINLESSPRWYCDEGTNIQLGVNMLHGHWGYLTWGPNFFAPFYDFLLGLVFTTVSETYFAARLVSAIFGASSCILIYLIGKQLYSRSIGLSSALLLSIASMPFNRMAMQENGVEFFFLLSVYSYLKLRDDGKKRWVYLAGASSGLAFLSNYIGLVAPIFLAFQSLIDRKLSKVKTSIGIFVILSLAYPLIGLLDWSNFIFDTLYQASHSFTIDHLLWTLMASAPPYKSEVGRVGHWFCQLGNWSILGFASVFYIAAKRRESDSLLFTALVCPLIIFVLVGDAAWWIHTIIIYPFYCLAMAIALRDIFCSKGNMFLLSIIPISIVVLPQLAEIIGIGIYWNVKILYFAILLLVSLLVFAEAYLHHKKNANRNLIRLRTLHEALLIKAPKIGIACFLILLSLGLTFYGLQSLASNEIGDQIAVVNFINSNTSEDDLVAANPALTPLLKCVGIDYFHVAFYTTKKPLFLYEDVEKLYPRFKMDCNLWNFKYIILDTQWQIEGGPRDAIDELTAVIYGFCFQVFSYGDYSVYQVPFYIKPEVSLVEGEDLTKVGRTGTWFEYTIDKILYGDRMVLSNVVGSKLTLNFTGSEIVSLILKGPDGGIMGVTVDGEVCDSIDLYNSVYTPPEAVRITINGDPLSLTDAPHTIEIIVTEAKNPASRDYFVRVDIFLILR